MVIRQRAIHAEHKQERYDALLDAALALLARAPDRVPSVADVADAAGLAKGTVYLYFENKAQLLIHCIAHEKLTVKAEASKIFTPETPDRERLRQ